MKKNRFDSLVRNFHTYNHINRSWANICFYDVLKYWILLLFIDIDNKIQTKRTSATQNHDTYRCLILPFGATQ